MVGTSQCPSVQGTNSNLNKGWLFTNFQVVEFMEANIHKHQARALFKKWNKEEKVLDLVARNPLFSCALIRIQKALVPLPLNY